MAKFAATVVAGLIILLAVGVGLFRVLLPQLPQYQREIEQWATEAIGLPVEFGRLDARWGLNGPEITVYDAVIFNRRGEAKLLEAPEASFGVDLLRLLRDRQLTVSRMSLHGLEVEVRRSKSGVVFVQDQPVGEWQAPGGATPSPEGLRFGDLPEVAIELLDATFVFRQASTEAPPWTFSGLDVSAQREGLRLRLEAHTELPESLGESLHLTVLLNAKDPEARLAQALDGGWRFTFDGRDLDLTGWSRLNDFPLKLPEEGRGDFLVHLDGLGRQPAKLRALLSATDLVLPEQMTLPGNEHPYDRLAATVEWTRRDDGWNLAVDDLVVTRGGMEWPSTSLSLAAEVDADSKLAGLRAELGYVELGDLTPFSVWLEDDLNRTRWQTLHPVGRLSDLKLEWRRGDGDSPSYQVQAIFAGLGVRGLDELPGLNGLSGELRADRTGGRVDLESRQVALTLDQLFRDTLRFDRLDGTLIWRQNRSRLRLVSDQVEVSNEDFSARADFELTVPLDEQPLRLELNATVGGDDISAMPRYLPALVMKPKAVAWLDQALLAGSLGGATVEFNGPLKAFPFDGGEGVFRVQSTVRDAKFRFHPDWPVIEGINAVLRIDKAGVEVETQRATIFAHQIRSATGRVDDLRQAIVEIDAVTSGPLQGVLAFIKTSPIINHISPRIQDVVTGGDVEVAVQLELPIRRASEYELNAQLSSTDAEIGLTGLPHRIEHIAGIARIKNAKIFADDLQATLLGAPVGIDVRPAGEEELGYRTIVAVSGRHTAGQIVSQLEFPWEQRLSGSLDWQASAWFPSRAPDTRVPFKILWDSDLDGFALDFPAPVAKTSAGVRAAQLELAFGEDETIQVNGVLQGNPRWTFSLAKADGDWRLARGAIRFGGGYPLLPVSEGLVLEGELDSMRLDEWLALAGPALAGNTSRDRLLKSMRVNASNLYAFGYRIPDVQIELDQSRREWLVQLESEAVAGSLFLPFNSGADAPLLVDMQRLRLSEPEPDYSHQADPRDFPPLKVLIRDFALENRNFGTLTAEVRQVGRGLSVEGFTTEAESFTTTGTASWLVDSFDPARQSTSLQLNLSSANVAEALARLGYGPVIQAEEAIATINVHWPGAPGGDWLASVSGEVSFAMSKGQLMEVDPGAGRVFGLMSIAALPRRLSLDFSDVFKQGLGFDEIKGDFLLKEGHAYTDNLKLDGPIAEIGVAGRVGLAERDYAEQAVVTAEVGNALPFAAAVIASPQIGAAMLLFKEIFKKPLKGIGRASYCITGDWDEPRVERLSAVEEREGGLCADLLQPNG